LIGITLRIGLIPSWGAWKTSEALIQSGQVRADEFQPFIIYWIKLIGDRRYRR
jgi:hypothetical protein